MPRIKKAKKEKPAETTEQFVARVSKKDETRNGKRVRFPSTNFSERLSAPLTGYQPSLGMTGPARAEG